MSRQRGRSPQSCAGTGVCATARYHPCKMHNDCRGQGGCGDNPGENQCRGWGACDVPLKPRLWDKARRRFEELMKQRRRQFGVPPLVAQQGSRDDGPLRRPSSPLRRRSSRGLLRTRCRRRLLCAAKLARRNITFARRSPVEAILRGVSPVPGDFASARHAGLEGFSAPKSRYCKFFRLLGRR